MISLQLAPPLLLFVTAAGAPEPATPPPDIETVKVKESAAPKPSLRADAAKIPGPSTEELVARVQRFYDAMEDYEARFVQVYTRLATSRRTESAGVLTVKKGGKVRWSYEKPEPKLFVADGRTLWIYEPLEDQVVVDRSFSAAKLGRSIAFLWGEGKITDSFTVKAALPGEHGFDERALALELTPKTDRSYRRLVIRVDAATGRVEESVVYETAGNLNRFRFYEPKLNQKVSDRVFTFVPPEGVDVVPLDGL